MLTGIRHDTVFAYAKDYAAQRPKTSRPQSCGGPAVEGFFAKLTNRRLKRGVFHSIVALQAAINRFVKEANQNPKPFRWTKDPDEIIVAVRRGHQALNSHH